MFVRTGLPPRLAKRLLTAREARDFAVYCAINPIDDQSNHHLPIANLQATVANLMGGTSKLTDFLIFHEHVEQDIDEQLLHGDW